MIWYLVVAGLAGWLGYSAGWSHGLDKGWELGKAGIDDYR